MLLLLLLFRHCRLLQLLVQQHQQRHLLVSLLLAWLMLAWLLLLLQLQLLLRLRQ